jgi:glycine cleavage system H protein
MPEYLETTVDKFTFTVVIDRVYTPDHLWLKAEGELVRIGLTDYLQQTAGDVAFAEPVEEGTELTAGDTLGGIETMKTTLVIPSPLDGLIKTVNPRLEDEPELVNQDPYGEGWLVQIEAPGWEQAQEGFLEPNDYYEQMKAEAEEEARKT